MNFRIKPYRKSLNLTQQELAERTGVSRTVISQMENGVPINITVSRLKKLADALGVTIFELFPRPQTINGIPAPDNLPEGVRRISEEEGYVHILRGLISYHERMTMGDCGRDIYLDALRFALTCVEEKISK